MREIEGHGVNGVGRKQPSRRVGRGRPTAEGFDVIIVGARCAGSPLAALLSRNGVRVTERIRATGARFMSSANVRQEDLEFTAPVPQRPGDVGGITSVRRLVLDPILAEVRGAGRRRDAHGHDGHGPGRGAGTSGCEQWTTAPRAS